MDKITKYTRRIITGIIVFIIIMGIIGIPIVLKRQYKTIISNFMDGDDIENAIHVFYTVEDNLNVSGKVTAKIKKKTDVTILAEYIGSPEISHQKYTIFRYLVQLNTKDHIIVSEDQFQAIKMDDYIQFQRDDDREVLFINMKRYEQK